MQLETIKSQIFEEFKPIMLAGRMKCNDGKGGVSFYFKDKNIRKGFGCSIASYHHIHTCEGFNASITFYDIEDLITPLLVRNELLGNIALKEKQSTITLKLQTLVGLDIPLASTKIEIVDESSLSKCIETFIEVYHLEVVPFFERWKDLPALNEFVLAQTNDVLFTALGGMMPFRKATILRLCNSSAYQSYMDSFYNEQLDLFNKNPSDAANKRYYSAAKELKEILDKTEPIY